MVFKENSLHCRGPILEAEFWAEGMVVLRPSAPPGVDSNPFPFHAAFSARVYGYITALFLKLGINTKNVSQKKEDFVHTNE